MTITRTDLHDRQLYWAQVQISPDLVLSRSRAEAAGFGYDQSRWIGNAPLYVVNGNVYRVVLPMDAFRANHFHENPAISDIVVHRSTHGYLTISFANVLEIQGLCDVTTLSPVDAVASTEPPAEEFDLTGYQNRVRERLIRESTRRGYSQRELDELLVDVGLQPSRRTYTVTAAFVHTMTFDVPAASETEAIDHIRSNVSRRTDGSPVNYNTPVTNTREIQSITAR
jgi:hypothetical protein